MEIDGIARIQYTKPACAWQANDSCSAVKREGIGLQLYSQSLV